MRNFLKQVVASLIGSFTGLVLFSALGTGTLVLIFVALAARDDEPQVSSDSVLVLDLSKSIQDSQPPLSVTEALLEPQNRPLTVHQVVTSLEQASKDEDISGILLDASDGISQSGYANLKEIRDALVAFQESDKDIFAYGLNWSEKGYYLASVSDKIFLNPMGNVEFNGLRVEQTFFAGALDEFGIGIDLVRKGNYKSAVEPFTRQELSQKNEEQLTTLLGDFWDEILNGIAQQREVTPAELQDLADTEGVLLAEQAQKAGLVDEIAYRDQVTEQLKELSGQQNNANSFPKVSVKNYSQATETSPDSAQEIAVVYAQGQIVSGEGSSDTIGSQRFARKLRKLRNKEQVKAVVFRINSPGGSATASDVISRQLQLTSEEKPVIMSMGNQAASGGYWLALSGDQILAQPTTITGSIGVFGIFPNLQELGNENGITWDEVATGELSGLTTISRPKTEQEIAVLQRLVDKTYDQFLERVADARNLSQQAVADVAQGRIWSGKRAKQIGLVDQLGGLDSAIAQAAEAAELGDNWSVQPYPKVSPFEEQFLQRFMGDSQFLSNHDSPLDQGLEQYEQSWKNLRVLNDPNQTYARLPFAFEIK